MIRYLIKHLLPRTLLVALVQLLVILLVSREVHILKYFFALNSQFNLLVDFYFLLFWMPYFFLMGMVTKDVIRGKLIMYGNKLLAIRLMPLIGFLFCLAITALSLVLQTYGLVDPLDVLQALIQTLPVVIIMNLAVWYSNEESGFLTIFIIMVVSYAVTKFTPLKILPSVGSYPIWIYCILFICLWALMTYNLKKIDYME